MGRAVKALIALVAGMLVLSGCAGQNPTHAATVNGVAIPVSEVDAMLPALKPYLQNPSAAAVVSLLVTSRVGVQIAQAEGIEFSAEEREAATASVLPPELAADPALTQFAADYVTTALVSQQIPQEDFVKAATAIDVEVNPRFGTWDASKLSVLPGTGSLSSPAP